MGIEVLDPLAYIATHEKVAGGMMGLTRKASIEWNDGEIRKCYVKAYPIHDRCLKVCNELAGYLLAEAIGLEQPKYAALLELPKSVWHEYNISSIGGDSERTVWCWVTCESGKSVKSTFGLDHYDDQNPRHRQLAQQAIMMMIQIECLPSLVAFDDFTANNDRNPGNLLIDSAGRALIIDHGEIFGREPWIDHPKSLDPSSIYHNRLLDWAFQADRTLPAKSRILKCAQNHNANYQSVKSSLIGWLKLLLEDAGYEATPQEVAIDCLHNFLHYRSQDVNVRFAKNLNMVI